MWNNEQLSQRFQTLEVRVMPRSPGKNEPNIDRISKEEHSNPFKTIDFVLLIQQAHWMKGKPILYVDFISRGRDNTGDCFPSLHSDRGTAEVSMAKSSRYFQSRGK